MTAPRVFGDVVRRARHEAGMTQDDLAECAGLHRNSVGRVETGSDATLSVCVKLAKALALPSDSLLLGPAHGR